MNKKDNKIMIEKPGLDDDRNHVVGADEAGMRLDRLIVLLSQGGIPYGTCQKWLRLGKVRLNGRKAKGNERVAEGDLVRLPLPAAMLSSDWAGHQGPLGHGGASDSVTPPIVRLTAADAAWLTSSVLLENDWFLAIQKPAGLSTQGGTGQNRSLDVLVNLWHGERGGDGTLRLVHRLDKDTTGVLLLAKTRQAAQYLTAAFRDKAMEKQYLAIVTPPPLDATGVVDAPIIKAYGSLQEKMVVRSDGQAARTHYRVVDQTDDLALVSLSPETGRTHQLRVHMAHRGSPILGDGKYGGTAAQVRGSGGRMPLHLHGYRIAFRGLDGAFYDITAPLPDFFQQTLAAGGLRLT